VRSFHFAPLGGKQLQYSTRTQEFCLYAPTGCAAAMREWASHDQTKWYCNKSARALVETCKAHCHDTSKLRSVVKINRAPAIDGNSTLLITVRVELTYLGYALRGGAHTQPGLESSFYSILDYIDHSTLPTPPEEILLDQFLLRILVCICNFNF